MRLYKNLVLLLLFLMLTLCLNAQVLEKRITYTCKETKLVEVLKDLKKKYQVNFSYSNNLVPLNKKVSFNVTDKTLNETLSILFKDTDVTFQVVGSHVVLKKSMTTSTKSHGNSLANEITDEEDNYSDTIIPVDLSQDTNTVDLVVIADTIVEDTIKVLPVEKPKNLSNVADANTLKKQYLVERRRLRDDYYEKMDSLSAKGDDKKSSEFERKFKRVMRSFRNDVNRIKDSLENKMYVTANDTIADTVSVEKMNEEVRVVEVDSLGYMHRPGQISFVYPLGTNGFDNSKIVNNVSLNVLTGYGAGVDGIEIGGLLNVDRAYVKGVQVAGIGNLVGKSVKGVQAAGIFNLNGAYTQGGQFAGIFNLVADSAYALQAAGIFNFVRRTSYGAQFAGIYNLAAGDYYGPQFSGMINTTTGNMNGFQAAGLINLAPSGINGSQAAGCINIAGGRMRGVQISGLVNLANKVRGSQIGFLNIADSVSGVQVGFLSICRQGYHKFELYHSDVFLGNLAFKTGTTKFHNTFALSVTPMDNDSFKWGVGYGFGSQAKISNRLILNFDAIAYHVNEDHQWLNELNLLNQLKTTVGFKFFKNMSLFAGPTINVMVSNYVNPDTNEIGSSVAPKHSFFDETSGRTNVKMWVGYNVGLRF